MDWSTFTNEPRFIDYMVLRVHEHSEVGDLARGLLATANVDGELGPARLQPRFVVIDELLDFVTELEREAAAKAWTDYRDYLRRWRKENADQEAA